MTIEIERAMKENQDYELVPSGSDIWNVRILSGDFVETVIKFGTVKLTESDELSYNFEIVDSPDGTLHPENGGLQKAAGAILLDVIGNQAGYIGDKKDG